MKVLCKTIYIIQEDSGLHLLHDGDSLPTSDWKDDNTPEEQFKEYIKLDPQWALMELVDTETRDDIIKIVFLCILPPETDILKGEWKPLKKEHFNEIDSPTLYKAMQKIQ